MRLRYEILWFDDNEEVVNEDIGDEIREYLDELGFIPVITYEKNGRNFNEVIENTNYDLIISDLNLGSYETGDEIIKRIRQQSIFTEVLLYSAVVSDISKIIDSNGKMIERISFAVGMKALPSKIKNIINLSIKKVQDVNNMRGLVMAETIDLEFVLEDTIKKYFEIFPEQKLDDKRQKQFESLYSKKVKKCKESLDFLSEESTKSILVLMEKDIVTINDLYESIQKILKEDIKEINISCQYLSGEEKNKLLNRKEELCLIKEDLNSFNNDIIRLRNTLAHVQEKVDDQGVPYLESLNKSDGTKIVFNDNKYSEIRKDIRRHSNNLLKIKNYIYSLSKVQPEVAAGKCLETYSEQININ